MSASVVNYSLITIRKNCFAFWFNRRPSRIECRQGSAHLPTVAFLLDLCTWRMSMCTMAQISCCTCSARACSCSISVVIDSVEICVDLLCKNLQLELAETDFPKRWASVGLTATCLIQMSLPPMSSAMQRVIDSDFGCGTICSRLKGFVVAFIDSFWKLSYVYTLPPCKSTKRLALGMFRK